jgi:hypothetical protein
MYLTKLMAVIAALLSQRLALGVDLDLVGLARQEETRRHSFRFEVPLFTNDALSLSRNARVSFSPNPSETIQETNRPLDSRLDPGEVEKKDSLYLLKDRLRSTRARLVTVVNLLNVLHLRHNHLRNLYLNASDEIQRMRFEAELRNLLDKLSAAEIEEKQARENWRLAQSEALKLGLKPEGEPSQAVSVTEPSTTGRNLR